MRKVAAFLLLIGCATILCTLTGCCCLGGRGEKAPPPIRGASVYVAPVPSPIERIAIMPFKASTELIGLSTSDLFVTELLRMGRYHLVERGQLSSVLTETEVALSGLTDAQAMELGNMLGADGVVIGTVDEYGTVARRGKTYAVVGISVRLIDCETGRVMWTASLASSCSDPNAALSQHARSVVRSTVLALQKQLRVQRQVRRRR